MKIITKIFKYDSSKTDYKGEDFSKYCLIGDMFQDNLDDTLDTYELTLAGLSFRQEFEPTTKFIIEKYLEDKGEITPYKSWHFIVSTDQVTQPILSDDNYFDHHLSLIEVGALAQKRLVDNISVTYKLKDVSLDQVPTYDTDLTIQMATRDGYINPSNYLLDGENYGENTGFMFHQWAVAHKFAWEMPDYYNVTLTNDGVTTTAKPSWNDWKKLKINQVIPSTSTNKQIQLPVPVLKCYSWTPGTRKLNKLNGYCSYTITVQKYDRDKNIIATNSWAVHPNSNYSQENKWTLDEGNLYQPNLIPEFGRIVSRVSISNISDEIEHYTTVAYKGSTANGVLLSQSGGKFTTLTNRVLSITLETNYDYKIFASLYIPDDIPDTDYYKDYYDKYPALISNGYMKGFKFGWDYQFASENLPSIQSAQKDGMMFYVYKQGMNGEILFKSAPPANAYDLFNKAQLTTQIHKKDKNYTVDETPKTFYLEAEFEQRLKNTTIIESFYSQNNLWQIFMDIGKYIHGRPVVNFGEDDRFVVGFKEYGKTNQKTDAAQKISVFNSKFIEEYISSVSSYVTNMVQLGGQITEIVSPKSTSEDYLVYNDVAKLITSKPIIEILDVDVIDINPSSSTYNVRKNLTGNPSKITNESTSGYIFEKGVYSVLAEDETVSVNKGLAIYYELGTNEIKGLDYTIPAINSGDSLYSIKNILGTVFSIGQSNWDSIKVNNYQFVITYRTKDTLRTDQTRPDLRKYLLSSKYDNVPQLSQFNNQTETVVDSIKFGNKLYGELIRTGNSVYSVVEWVDNPFDLKESGDLYNIFGNLYYVSKVTHTFYPNHIISNVEYSKDFNRLSQIIGIPSEPRFYEISEQSAIDREVAINDYILLGTNTENLASVKQTTLVKDSYLIETLLFGSQGTKYPQYALTVFKGDELKNNKHLVATLHPIATYSLENTLTMEWDMKDNFSAGDQLKYLDNVFVGNKQVSSPEYYALNPVGYTDVYGRADMFDFKILQDIKYEKEFVKGLPKVEYLTITDIFNNLIYDNEYYAIIRDGVKQQIYRNAQITSQQMIEVLTTLEITPSLGAVVFLQINSSPFVYKYTYNTSKTFTITGPFYNFDYAGQTVISSSAYTSYMREHDKGLVLLKDNREVMKFNYNLQMLTESDRFVLSSYMWQQEKTKVRIALLNKEVNKISTGIIEKNSIIKGDISFNYGYWVENWNIVIKINEALANEDLTNVKSIVIYNSNLINNSETSGSYYFVFARNIDDLTEDEAKKDWLISGISKDMFTKQ